MDPPRQSLRRSELEEGASLPELPPSGLELDTFDLETGTLGLDLRGSDLKPRRSRLEAG